MADNITLNVGAGGVQLAADEISGIVHQRVKVQYGDDGSATDVSTASPLPISDAGGSLTVDGTVSISGGQVDLPTTTLYKNIDVDESEDEIKSSAGAIYWIHCINLSAAPLFLKVYNDTAANVIVGTTVPDLTFPVPTSGATFGAGFTLSIPNGIAFSTAITVAATTGIADADTGAPGANECVLNLGYV